MWGRNSKTSFARVLLHKHFNNTNVNSSKLFPTLSRYLSSSCRLPRDLVPHPPYLRLSDSIRNGCPAKHLCVGLRYDSEPPILPIRLQLKGSADMEICKQAPTHRILNLVQWKRLLYRNEMASSITTERSGEESRIEGHQLFSCNRTKRYNPILHYPYSYLFHLISRELAVHGTDELLICRCASLHRWRYLMHESRTTFHKDRAEIWGNCYTWDAKGIFRFGRSFLYEQLFLAMN
jgi:hypothetical protein